ncbi:hypothetical protein PENARI_c001G12544 [Penicillium arizonense]|uniref:Rhodopsin domain-containing protein n=1 Tax=Penicillium arizonense TaxID=1835702 RepID=A0A1F5LZ37_PENAI|nr:hypothetical protein PENARI_c001G12544 [Penicillium arizonense]OGE58191.1 hypothetical protein PENARI_c001G12544 [Penicillium arizonense]
MASPTAYPPGAVAICHASLVMTQVHYGWGIRKESAATTDSRMLKIGYAAEILAIVVLGLSKITTCIFYGTLFSQMQHRSNRIAFAGMIIWMVMAMLLLAIRCSHDPWYDISANQCGSLLSRWEVITTIDIFTEVALFLYSGLAIYKVKIPTKKKLIVFLALESRVILVPLAAIRFYFTKRQIDSKYPILLGAFATITTEIYLSFSVICLVSAFIKSFLAVYEDKNGLAYTEGGSGFGSSSIKHSSTATASNPRSHTSQRLQRLIGREEDEEPMIDPVQGSGGLQIVKTVRLSLHNESIELADRRADTRPQDYH